MVAFQTFLYVIQGDILVFITNDHTIFTAWLPYLPKYNVQFFPLINASKIEMHIMHEILCF